MARKQNPEEVRRVIVERMDVTRPILVGPLSLELNCSLAEIEEALLALCQAGFLRQMSSKEMQRFGVRHGFMLGSVPREGDVQPPKVCPLMRQPQISSWCKVSIET